MKDTSSYLASDVEVDGKITCSGPVRIDGKCQGIVEGKESVTIGTSAQIQGTVHAQSLVINGQMEGELITTGTLAILSEGKIKGKIFTPPGGVTVAKGGNFEGNFCTMPVAELPKLDVSNLTKDQKALPSQSEKSNSNKSSKSASTAKK